MISEENDRSGESDTSRFLVAGAHPVWWVRTEQGRLAEAMPAVRQRIAGTSNIIVESNSVLRFLRPDFYVTVVVRRPRISKLQHRNSWTEPTRWSSTHMTTRCSELEEHFIPYGGEPADVLITAADLSTDGPHRIRQVVAGCEKRVVRPIGCHCAYIPMIFSMARLHTPQNLSSRVNMMQFTWGQ